MLGSKKKPMNTKVDTLIGEQSEMHGDVMFSGGLHVDGTVKGSVIANGDSSAVLVLGEKGVIEGEVKVPHVVLNGAVIGDVHCSGCVELAPQARVTGHIYYNRIEMAMGAQVNGQLVYVGEDTISLPSPGANQPLASPDKLD